MDHPRTHQLMVILQHFQLGCMGISPFSAFSWYVHNIYSSATLIVTSWISQGTIKCSFSEITVADYLMIMWKCMKLLVVVEHCSPGMYLEIKIDILDVLWHFCFYFIINILTEKNYILYKMRLFIEYLFIPFFAVSKNNENLFYFIIY